MGNHGDANDIPNPVAQRRRREISGRQRPAAIVRLT
jgi:hypothetical protein